jgi:formylglycine-generating enzyme
MLPCSTILKGWKQLLVALSSLAATCATMAWETNHFFRVSTTNQSSPTVQLARDGVLSWNLSPTGGTYIIERAPMASTGWLHYARGVSSNEFTSVQVIHSDPPPGFRFIPGGRFMMGDILRDHTVADPVHPVQISSFFMLAHEVTTGELAEVFQWAYEKQMVMVADNFIRDLRGTNLVRLGAVSSELRFATNRIMVRRPGREMYPANHMTWYGAVTYCNFLSMMHGLPPSYNLEVWSCNFTNRGYRLPTESEWEYASRAGAQGRRFPWHDSDTITHSQANYRSSTNNAYDISVTRGYHPENARNIPSSSPVGSFAMNQYGLYDMSGNVWEWVWDWWNRYPAGFLVDPTGPATGRHRIFRGGAWKTTAERVTNASRYISAVPDSTVEDVGFRIAIPLPRINSSP